MPRQIQLQRPAPGLWRATFDHPPINLIDPDTIEELAELIGQLETDRAVRVIVFDSADPDFFLAHCDRPPWSVPGCRRARRWRWSWASTSRSIQARDESGPLSVSGPVRLQSMRRLCSIAKHWSQMKAS